MRRAKEIKSITEQIIKHYKPEKIILFGSFARGGATPSSDVDLLIVKKTGKKRVKRIHEVLMLIDSGLPLEPLVYSPGEVKERLRLGDMFLQDVFEHGKVLYDKG